MRVRQKRMGSDSGSRSEAKMLLGNWTGLCRFSPPARASVWIQKVVLSRARDGPIIPCLSLFFFVGGACGTEGALDCCTDVRDAYKYATQSRSSLGPGQGALNAFHQSLLWHHFGFAENHFRKLFYVRLGCLADGVVLQRGGLRLDVTQPHS